MIESNSSSFVWIPKHAPDNVMENEMERWFPKWHCHLLPVLNAVWLGLDKAL